MIEERIEYIRTQFKQFPETVYIGFSGGKDSSAVVKLLYTATRNHLINAPRFVVVYCNTGVENPIVDRFAKETLTALAKEAQTEGLSFACKVIEPELDQSFFVRIIGRGYPPPTNTFRWCTKDTRIRPFRNFLKSRGPGTLIAIGTRRGESHQRDRSLSKSVNLQAETEFYQKQREGFSNAVLFTPIIDFDVGDVWETLVELQFPKSIRVNTLAKIYKDGSGECPTVRDFKDKPCSKARFGCWTCTVVRRDRSAERMIEEGHSELVPYSAFRQWLIDIRNDPQYRCRGRRNGTPGLGPFNLKARRLILRKLEQLEQETGQTILTEQQRVRIQELWNIDRASEHYAKLE